ncbi:MFS transporter [Nonomuraea sp. NN258]|uniref:MFS transporter n=1 Tax=Nonomuraea antri TaxID=2730852 RepID=UPI001569E395|nr:MFS transporter [Nonomuraea antri]NRQ35372.1 MFS transporter [Nonomuraea antri]
MTATLTEAPLLRDRGFRNLFLATAVSQLGSQIGYVALPLLAVTALGAGAAEVGLLSSLSTLTVLVLGLPAGAWVDRVRRRPVMVVMDLARALVLLSVPVAWWLDGLSLVQLYAVAMLVGAGTLLFDVASFSLVPGVVGRERLTAANSMLVGTTASMGVAGQSLAGVLVQVAGAPLAILLDGLSYLWSAAWLRRVPEPPVEAPQHRPPMRRQIVEGVRFVFGNPVLTAALVQGALVNLAFPLLTVLLPVLIVRQLGYPEWVLGAFLAVGAVGTLAGSSAAHALGRRLGTGRATWLAGLATAPAALVVPFLGHGPWLGAAALAWFVLTFRTGLNNVLLVSLRQRVTPDDLLGRMTATMRLLLMGAIGLGGLLAGLIGELWGVRAALWTGALIMALSWVPILYSPLREEP